MRLIRKKIDIHSIGYIQTFQLVKALSPPHISINQNPVLNRVTYMTDFGSHT